MSARCPNCAAALPPDAAPGGWCEVCGKSLPDHIFTRRAQPEPDGPALPVDDAPFQYRYPVPLVVGGMVAVVVGFVVAHHLAPAAVVPAALLAIIALTACGIMLVLNATTNKKLNRDLLALQSGEYLVRWEYSSAAWLRFVAADWRRGRRWALLVVFGLVVTGGLLAWLPRNTDDDIAGLVAALCGSGAVVLIGGGMLASEWRSFRRRSKKRGVAFIGHGVACVGGRCALWGRSGWALSTVRVIDGDPAVLEIVRNASESRTEFRVLIPRGREAEARGLVSKLMRGG